MSKRKVQFAEPPKPEALSKKVKHGKQATDKEEGRDEVDYNEDLGDSGESGSEGEGAEQGNVMNMDELEVEEKTVEYDEDVKITPFNLNEELEEGHFDRDGTFVFNKKSNIKDSWLDEYDFADVRQLESARMAEEKRQAHHDVVNESADLTDEKMSDQQIYEQILPFLQQGESILRAVRRLGNATKSLSASERLKLKKLAAKQGSQPGGGAASATDVEIQKKQLARLTELSDLLIRRGHMNAYEETLESLLFHIKPTAAAKVIPAGDMFSDDFTEAQPTSSTNTTQATEESDKTKEVSSPVDDVRWEYKMSLEEGTDGFVIHGPVPTAELMDLISASEKDGKQASTFYIRRHGSSGQFYNSSRVDFSLYID